MFSQTFGPYCTILPISCFSSQCFKKNRNSLAWLPWKAVSVALWWSWCSTLCELQSKSCFPWELWTPCEQKGVYAWLQPHWTPHSPGWPSEIPATVYWSAEWGASTVFDEGVGTRMARAVQVGPAWRAQDQVDSVALRWAPAVALALRPVGAGGPRPIARPPQVLP